MILALGLLLAGLVVAGPVGAIIALLLIIAVNLIKR